MPIQTAIDSISNSQGSPFGFKNRIINGAMVFDQRNAGASFTPLTQTYGLDRWMYSLSQSSKLTGQQSTTAPVGFTQSNLITSSSSYTVGASEVFLLRHKVEGYNVADLGWGTVNAKTVTLSFWVRSSLTGTFGGSVRNENQDRSFPFSYTISTANTFEYKSVTIAGDTSGTWVTNNAVGIELNFSVGSGSTVSNTAGSWYAGSFASATGATSVVGTNGATFYITGVQLEVGAVATSFDYRPISTELALCQRYFEKSYAQGVVPGTATDDGRMLNAFGTSSSAYIAGFISYRVIKRAAATPSVYAASNGTITQIDSFVFGTSTTRVTPTIQSPIDTGFGFYFNGTTANAYAVHYAVSAEL